MQKIIPTVGTDITEPGKYYWDIKSADRDVLFKQGGFKSLAEAKLDLGKTMQDLAKAFAETKIVIENLPASR